MGNMKYIKKFESIDKGYGKYWLLPTGDKFEDSLKKIGCPKLSSLNFLKNKEIKKDIFVFIGVSFLLGWGWNRFDGNIRNIFYDADNYEYMGHINIDNWELDVKPDVKKYNL